MVGSTTTIAGGDASIHLNTTGLAPGTYHLLARAVDSAGHWSTPATVTLTVSPADDYGNNAATAAAVATPSSTSGTIGVGGDVDWFKFQAVAGKHYTLATQLGTLNDSVLSLYDRNGTTLLASNDDYGSSLASRIDWTAPASGTYYLVVAGYGNDTGSYTLSVQAQNSAPVLAPIADQTMSRAQTVLTVPLNASDADGDPLSYSVQVVACDPLAKTAYDLDQQLGLYEWGGSYWTNLRGANEKYLASTTNGLAAPCFILPNGQLYRWGGSIAASTLVATLSSAYYANPSLLVNAQPPVYSPVASSNVSASVSGSTLTITRAAGYTNDLSVRISVSDGTATTTSTFNVSVTNAAPQMAAIPDQVMPASQNSLSLPVTASDPDGDPLTYSAAVLTVDPLAQEAYNLSQQLGLYQWGGSYWTNLRSANEKYLASSTNGLAAPCFILPNGQLYRWGGSIAASTLVATLSPAYYANPALLINAQPPVPIAMSGVSVTVSMAGNVMTINRVAGYANNFFIRATVSDGAATCSETFQVSTAAAAATKVASAAIGISDSPATPSDVSVASPSAPLAPLGNASVQTAILSASMLASTVGPAIDTASLTVAKSSAPVPGELGTLSAQR